MNNTEYIKLCNQMQKYNHAYYNLSKSIVTDSVYDTLLKSIIAYEKKNPNKIIKTSPTQYVGSKSIGPHPKVDHITKMYSLSNIYNFEELKQWITKRQEDEYTEFIIEPKYDGVSLNLLYNHNVLVKAITRGDGLQGSNVIKNIVNNVKLLNIPRKLNYGGDIEIRGEVVCSKKIFKNINNMLDKKTKFKNVRNFCSGTILAQDHKILASRELLFIPYGIGANSLNLITHDEVIDYFKQNNFYTPFQHLKTRLLHELENYKLKLEEKRKTLDIQLDGVVITLNDRLLNTKYGYTAKVPRFSVAYKFEPVSKDTTLVGVIDSVTSHGHIVPVGIVNPIELDGATIKKVTLHNYDYVEKMMLGLGDKVKIIKSGDIIPKIVENLSKNDKDKPLLTPPDKCPSCTTKLVKIGKRLVCNNEIDCRRKTIERIKLLVSRKGLDIKNIGEKTIETILDNSVKKDILTFLKYVANNPAYKIPKYTDKQHKFIIKIPGCVDLFEHQDVWKYSNITILK